MNLNFKGTIKMKYKIIMQDNLSNNLARVNTNRDPMRSLITGDNEIKSDPITIVTTQLKIGAPEAQMLDYLNMLITNKDCDSDYNAQGHVDRIYLTLNKFMKDFGLRDKKSARKEIINRLNALANIRVSYRKANNKPSGDYDQDAYNGGLIEFVHVAGSRIYSIHILDLLDTLIYNVGMPMPYPNLMFLLSARYDAVAWSLLREMTLNLRMNLGKKRANRLSAKKILEVCKTLPTIDKVNGSKDRHPYRRIIEPILEAAEEIANPNFNKRLKSINPDLEGLIETYHWEDAAGNIFDWTSNFTFDEFKKSTLVVDKWNPDWLNYLNNTVGKWKIVQQKIIQKNKKKKQQKKEKCHKV